MHGNEQIGAPSSFLKELPEDCLIEVRPRAPVLRPAFGGRRIGTGPQAGAVSPRPGLARPRVGLDRSKLESESAAGEFKLGMHVTHPKFGNGTIIGFDGSGDRTQVEIRFDRAGTKRLMLSFAKLSLA